MIPEHKQQALIAAKKAHSHLGKVIKMMEDDHYCIEVMQQVLAVQGLLKSINDKMMRGHFNTCVRKAMESKSEQRKQEAIDEVMQVLDMSTR